MSSIERFVAECRGRVSMAVVLPGEVRAIASSARDGAIASQHLIRIIAQAHMELWQRQLCWSCDQPLRPADAAIVILTPPDKGEAPSQHFGICPVCGDTAARIQTVTAARLQRQFPDLKINPVQTA